MAYTIDRRTGRKRYVQPMIAGNQWLVRYYVDDQDRPCAPGSTKFSRLGRLFTDEFEARAFAAAYSDPDGAAATVEGPAVWQLSPITGEYRRL